MSQPLPDLTKVLEAVFQALKLVGIHVQPAADLPPLSPEVAARVAAAALDQEASKQAR